MTKNILPLTLLAVLLSCNTDVQTSSPDSSSLGSYSEPLLGSTTVFDAAWFTPSTFSVVGVQAALDSGRSVRLWPGSYDMGSDSLIIEGNGNGLIGEGMGLTVLHYSGTGSAFLFNPSSTNTFGEVRNITIHGQGDAVTQGTGITIGSPTGSAARVHLADVEIKYFGTGVYFNSSQLVRFDRVTFLQITDVAIDTDDSLAQNHARFNDLIFRQAKHHVRTGRARGWTFDGCDFTDANEESIVINNAGSGYVYQFQVKNSWFESNNGNNVFDSSLQQGAATVKISAEGSIHYAQDIKFNGNVWSNNGPQYNAFIGDGQEAYFSEEFIIGGLMKLDYSTVPGLEPRLQTPGRMGKSNSYGWDRLYEAPVGATILSVNRGDITEVDNSSNSSRVTISRLQSWNFLVGDTCEVWVRGNNSALRHGTLYHNISLPNGTDILVNDPTMFRFVLVDDGIRRWVLVGSTPTGA